MAKGVTGRQHNLIEQKIYEEVEYTDYGRHFAKIYGVSPTGQFLIMDKVFHKEPKKYPERVPHFFTDRKHSNYGWVGNRFVCCDYAGTFLTEGFTKKTIKANWWEE